jgi:cytoskeletal protein RodZ
MTESIGQQLRKARESQRLGLEQAAQRTRIKLHYLQALEADNFDALPSRVQQRGFLRSYAELLALPVEPLLAQLAGEPLLGAPAPVEDRPPGGEAAGASVGGGDPAGGPPSSGVGAVHAPHLASQTILQELGGQLRRQREALGLTLEDVERHTHLRLHYLQALENGRLEGLPSPVQGRGMLNNYAVFLGLEPEPVLLRYAEGLQADLKARQEVQRQRAGEASGRKRGRQPGFSRLLPGPLRRMFSSDLWIGALLVLFLVGFVAWAALRISQMQSTQSPTSTAPSIAEVLAPDTPTSTPSPFITDTAAAGEAPLPVEGEASEATPTLAPLEVETTATVEATPDFPAATSGKIQLYLVARQRAWTRVTVDGDVELEGRVIPGSAYLFTGEDRIELLTGNGAALQIFLNRQDLGPVGIYGEVVGRVFTLEGMQTPTPAVPPTPTPTSTPEITDTPVGTPGSGTPTTTPSPTPPGELP